MFVYTYTYLFLSHAHHVNVYLYIHWCICIDLWPCMFVHIYAYISLSSVLSIIWMCACIYTHICYIHLWPDSHVSSECMFVYTYTSIPMTRMVNSYLHIYTCDQNHIYHLMSVHTYLYLWPGWWIHTCTYIPVTRIIYII